MGVASSRPLSSFAGRVAQPESLGEAPAVSDDVGQIAAKIRFGNPALAGLVIAFMTAMALFLGVMGTLAAIAPGMPSLFRGFFGLLASLVLLTVLGIAVVFVRNPRIASRTILITTKGVLLPVRRVGLIPFAEIAGVGLTPQRNPRNGLPGGNWALTLWRSDGSRAGVGGLQGRAQIADPSNSRIAQAARELYVLVLDRQGPEGPLSQLHLQRHATFGPFDPFTATWDPSESD